MTFKEFIHEFKKFYDMKYPLADKKSSFEKDGLCFYLEDGTKFAWSEKDSKNQKVSSKITTYIGDENKMGVDISKDLIKDRGLNRFSRIKFTKGTHFI
jgi:hypothetical protein